MHLQLVFWYFLIIDVFSHAWESVEETASDALAGKASFGDATIALFAMFGGLGIGLLGLTWYESKFIERILLVYH